MAVTAAGISASYRADYTAVAPTDVMPDGCPSTRSWRRHFEAAILKKMARFLKTFKNI